MKFDWYEATVQARPREVVEAVLGRAGGLGEVRPRKGTTYGYDRAYDVAIGPQVLASVFYGGTAQGAGVHAVATGAQAIWFAPMCREWSHVVTRLDVAEDYHGEGAFERLSGMCVELAKERGLRTFTVGDWAQGKEGRTLYVGASTSAVRVRCYEKGKEYHARGVSSVPATWARLEGVFRPKQAARLMLSRALPAECFGMSSWSRELLRRMSGLEVETLADASWTASDDNRAWQWLTRQYGPLLGRVKEQLGSWEAVGAQLGRDIVTGDA